ncbi:MAG: peptidyl-tRNA hydrolase [Chitinophagales bacterium]|nr:MAG: peptidyl-tRNA hydrolase [Chitinophagales bacterium]
MKFLIAGLGNIGDEYVNTRHNIGFQIVDRLAGEIPGFTSGRLAYHCSVKYKGRTLYLIKPTTYMNLSGKAVKYWLDNLRMPLEHLLVVTDDIALPFGKLRIRKSGSDGGHNGLKSIIEALGTNAFPRLRFGIGSNFPKGYQTEYVLGTWTPEEQKMLAEKIDYACEAIRSFTTLGIDRTMNLFN